MEKFVFLFFFGFIWQACQKTDPYHPNQHLSTEAQHEFLYNIMRYVAKRPKGVSYENRADTKFDDYYRKEMDKFRLRSYFISSDSTHYFLVERIAPSLYEKWVATGGRLRYDDQGRISSYEEVFRTWKMPEEELIRKGAHLFRLLIEKGHVDGYLPHQTEEEWVEFPDERTYYDSEARQWRTKGQTPGVPLF